MVKFPAQTAKLSFFIFTIRELYYTNSKILVPILGVLYWILNRHCQFIVLGSPDLRGLCFLSQAMPINILLKVISRPYSLMTAFSTLSNSWCFQGLSGPGHINFQACSCWDKGHLQPTVLPQHPNSWPFFSITGESLR